MVSTKEKIEKIARKIDGVFRELPPTFPPELMFKKLDEEVSYEEMDLVRRNLKLFFKVFSEVVESNMPPLPPFFPPFPPFGNIVDFRVIRIPIPKRKKKKPVDLEGNGKSRNIEMEEGEDHIIAIFEFPGIKKNDLVIKQGDKKLYIYTKEGSNRKYREIVNLPSSVENDGVKGMYRNGILTLTFKKKKNKK